MQIRMKENMTRDEALMLLEVANAEVAALRQQLTEHEETIEQLAEVLRVNETEAGHDVKVWAKAMLDARAALAQGEV